jgi:Domain of unknown function (DUF4159)/Aerotolerance regulator N-terminal
MLSLGGLAFASPWLLLGFAIVPALWWLLRVTPPAPQVLEFPAIRLLLGLVPPEETPARTPLWLILMRMVLASLLILALAQPLLNPTPALPGSEALLLVVDDGWASAPDWSARQHAIDALLERADRENRKVMLLPTAPTEAAPAPLSLLRPADAKSAVGALKPKPWPADRAAAAKRLDALDFQPGMAVYWFADGLDDKGPAHELLERLRRLGPVRFVAPPSASLARLLTPPQNESRDLAVSVQRAALGDAAPVTLRALGADGRLLARAEARFPEDRGAIDAAFKIPTELRNRVDRIEIEGESSAGAVLLIDERSRRRPVGIAAETAEGSSQPLLSDTYYLERAVEPFAELRRGAPLELIKRDLSLLILPDGDVGADEHKALKSWIEAGGVLVRFAGPLLAERDTDDLLPVTLRRGGRTIGGAMSWEKPAHLAPFAAESPFEGLEVPADVTVDRQVLAEPSVDLAAKTWAQLTDGTPLVTGEKRGKGWLVLLHTSANTSWSNLALSGLFVDMLRRLVQLGQGMPGSGEGVLPPWQTMDGFGRLDPPSVAARPIAATDLAKTSAGPSHPPGFYGTDDSHRAFNLAASVAGLIEFGALPGDVVREGYVPAPEIDLRPPLLGLALLLALIDILVGYGLRGLLRTGPLRAALLLIGLVAAGGASAQGTVDPRASISPADRYTIEATSQLRLAYVKTGDPETDQVSRAAMNGLGTVLSRRTAVETGDPMEVDVEADEMIFFPLIYWPVTAAQKPLSAEAAERVNRYIATGGTLLFDTRDEGSTGGGFGDDQTAEKLRTLLAGVKIPPLVQIPPDHVLTKSFYLMQDFPGRWVGGTLWVEPVEDRINDGVSTVILGSNDFAAAWAVDAQGLPSFAVVPGGEQQREQAYRFGVNLVMYALTGNYKADQVHVPAILERLGQ